MGSASNLQVGRKRKQYCSYSRQGSTARRTGHLDSMHASVRLMPPDSNSPTYNCVLPVIKSHLSNVRMSDARDQKSRPQRLSSCWTDWKRLDGHEIQLATGLQVRDLLLLPSVPRRSKQIGPLEHCECMESMSLTLGDSMVQSVRLATITVSYLKFPRVK